MFEAAGTTWHAGADAVVAAAAGLDKRQVNLCNIHTHTHSQRESEATQSRNKGSATTTTTAKLFMRLRV